MDLSYHYYTMTDDDIISHFGDDKEVMYGETNIKSLLSQYEKFESFNEEDKEYIIDFLFRIKYRFLVDNDYCIVLNLDEILSTFEEEKKLNETNVYFDCVQYDHLMFYNEDCTQYTVGILASKLF